MKKTILLLTTIIALLGCESTKNTNAKQHCSPADNINYVSGGKECLRIKTTNNKNNPKSLVIMLHGDVSRGGPSDYLYERVSRLHPVDNDMTVVTLIRPGYYDSEGNYSSGTNTNRRDSYTAHNVDSIVSAIQSLKKYYNPRKVIVAGHSGGAAITANIIGRHQRLIDGVVLASCPCNIREWRQTRGRKAWSRSLSPSDVANNVTSTEIVALSGLKDENTFPKLSSDYINQLKGQRGNRAKFISINASHNGVARSPEFYTAIIEMAK